MRTGIIATLICATILASSSCSVKEDRSECLCILNLDYSLIRGDERFISASSWDSLLVSIPGTYSTIVGMEDHRDFQTIGVPRRKTDFSCYFGMSEGRIKGGNRELVIPYGEDADRLFSYHETLDLGPASEEVFVTPVLCGESTRIIVEFDNEAFLGENGILVATGCTCGLDLWSGRPLEGEFCCPLKSYGDGTWQFNMPRQASRDIALAAVSATSGNLFFSIDLASELDSAGYDWDARSLPPLAIVHIDSKEMTVDARIIDWDEAVYLDFTL